MKSSGGQYRTDVGDASLPRSSGQHVPVGGHPVYLAQHHASFGAQSVGEGSHGSRDYHPHHLQAQDLPHRSHGMGSGGIGISPGHTSMHHMPQRRRTSGQRLSLLWDIGVAGERERDRSESSGGSNHPHTYTTTAGSSHVITGPVLYGGRPTMTMMSSLGGLQASQKNLGSASQLPSGTPPRHNSSLGSLGRPSPSSLHPYSAAAGTFMLPGPSSVKSEPGIGNFPKEESKSPLPAMQPHYPQLLHPQPYSGHPSQHMTSKNDQPEKATESGPSKDSLVDSMEKVDKDIKKVWSEIKTLERKKQQLEEAGKKPPQAEKSASPKKVETKHKDLWQVIYAENKRKAEASRGMLDQLCKRYDMPLYNQPSDTKVYQENLKKNEEMRPKLLAYFQRSSQLASIRERYLSARYDHLMSDWQKKADRIEKKRKVGDAKVREFFEKQFPEIRKQREQQERFTRSGTRGGDACRSEADFNEIVDGLSEQENQEHHMRQLAVVPPMLLDRDQRRLKFINNNGLVTDPMEDYKKRQELDHWNAEEKQVFKEKYIQHPKNFHIIASFLEKKSVSDCVLFYYLSKKSVGYKSFVRKTTLKPRKVKAGRGNAQQSSTSGSTQGPNKNGQQDKGQGDKDLEQKRESFESIVKEEEVERIERPPSPIVTRSRNKNWSDEDVLVAKEGFERHGKDFPAVSRLFANKTEHQIKSFYNTFKKKYNLDQLIADGKKKKAEATTSSAVDSEGSSAPPRVTSSSASQIQTRRGKNAKRGSKSPTVDEPAEKKPRKSKAVKEVKTEPKEIPVEENQKVESDMQDKELEANNEEQEEQQSENVEARVQELPPEAAPDAVESSVSPVPAVEPDSTVLTSTVQVKAPAPLVFTTTTTETSTQSLTGTISSSVPETCAEKDTWTTQKLGEDASSQKSAANDGDSSATCSADEEPNMQDAELKVAARKHADSPYAFEDDSSASIKLESSRGPLPPLSSAPVMKQPLPAKTPPANVGRPLSRSPQPMTWKPEEKRPQSLPPPLGANVGGSVPIGALTFNPSRVPKESKADDSRPNSTPMMVPVYPPPPVLAGRPPGHAWMNPAPGYGGPHHIVGKVPDANEIRNALSQSGLHLPSTPNTAPPVKVKKPATSESYHTIDLTVPSTSANERHIDESIKARDQTQKLPHYHPVPHEASSLQKDFAPSRADAPPREDHQVQQRHVYTSNHFASMKERAASIPAAIPVSALRAPMPGISQRNDLPRSEPVPKSKETPSVIVDVGGPPKPYILPHGQPTALVYGAAPGVRPHLTTSPIPTKVLYGVTSGAPVRQSNIGKPLGVSAPAEVRRPDVITATHRATDPARYRSPGPEPTLLAARQYPELVKAALPQSRGPSVKPVGSDPLILVPDDSFKKVKSAPGSIMTGLPVHRPHDERTEHRTEVIAGKMVVVKQPYPRASPVTDLARFQDSEQMHGLQYPNVAHHRPVMPSKGSPGTGSIIDGTPVVKRKHSNESNSSLSPSANLTPYMGVVASRPSPTIPKHADRRPPSGHAPYHYLATAERMKEKDPFPGHQKLMRESQPRPGANSPGLRQTPTSAIVKQEFQSNPYSAGELHRRVHPTLPLMDFATAAANAELARFPIALPHIPLTAPGVSPDLLEIFRQYGACATGVPSSHVYPMPMALGLPGYPAGFSVQGLNPATSPGAPRSPHNDDSRETTKNMLNQAFETAQLMKLRNPVPVTVPGLPGVLPGSASALSVPGIGMSPLVVSAAGAYHHLVPGSYPHGGLPADRLVLPPGLARSPFSPQFPPHSGRSSTDNSRSPSQKFPKTGSPDVLRQRHRSSEAKREFAHHPVVRERNSPGSPYHPPGGNISPQRYPSQGPAAQLSPSHLPAKSYRGYPHASTPPAHPVHLHRHMTRSPHPHPILSHAYPTPEAAIVNRMHESRSPYEVQHGRTASLDGPSQPRFEWSRPDSAGPHPRSLNDPVGRYPTPNIRQQSQSPKYRTDSGSRSPQVVSHDQKVPQARDDRLVHRESPRPLQRRPIADHGDARLSQQPPALGGSYQVAPGGPRHEARSPYQPHQPKEREPIKERPQSNADVKPVRPEISHPSQAVSSNPGEDLKKSGRTKMKAATLIDQIIMNCVAQPPSHAKQPSDPGQRRLLDDNEAKQATLPAKTSYEAETRLPLSLSQGPAVRPFSMAQLHPSAAGPGPQLGKEVASTQPPMSARSMTIAKHSSDLIEQLYSKNASDGKPPARTNSPHPPKPTPMVADTISPPDKRILKPGNSEASQPPLTVRSQMQQQTRFPGSLLDSKPPLTGPSSVLQPMNPQVAGMPGAMSSVRTTSGSLEDIIRNALMDGNRPPNSMDGSHDKNAVGININDMILSHAVMSMSARPALPKPTPEARKEASPSTTQGQGGSTNYVSALMFRSAPSQNATPPAAAERAQQFYQAQNRPSHTAPQPSSASQSPASQESNPQARQTILMPQYEALSDSDE